MPVDPEKSLHEDHGAPSIGHTDSGVDIEGDSGVHVVGRSKKVAGYMQLSRNCREDLPDVEIITNVSQGYLKGFTRPPVTTL
jgi:hypothetical protein